MFPCAAIITFKSANIGVTGDIIRTVCLHGSCVALSIMVSLSLGIPSLCS